MKRFQLLTFTTIIGKAVYKSKGMTLRWTVRVCSTVLGMVFTNVFFAYRYDCASRQVPQLDDCNAFLGKAVAGWFKTDSCTCQEHPELRLARLLWVRWAYHWQLSAGVISPCVNFQAFQPVLAPFIDLRQYAGIKGTDKRAQRRCKRCGVKTSYYCTGWSKPQEGIFTPLSSTKKTCYFMHMTSAKLTRSSTISWPFILL